MSTRLIVKNLPPYCTPDRLKQHFQQKGAPAGTITDAKVSFKPDGTSRRFGFVGFKTAQEAARAQEWFNRTFIDSARLDVRVVEVRCSCRSGEEGGLMVCVCRRRAMSLHHGRTSVLGLDPRRQK
jgi:multiple RNA-binding domain-containing protein 1